MAANLTEKVRGIVKVVTAVDNGDLKRNITVTFFFASRRRHTSLTCDWSSDVCSSDLDADYASAGCARGINRNTEPCNGVDTAGGRKVLNTLEHVVMPETLTVYHGDRGIASVWTRC